MFGLKRRMTAPPKCEGNPGSGITAKTAFTNGLKSWEEDVDLVRIANDVLVAHGYQVENHHTFLKHNDSSIAILPLFVAIQPLKDGGVSTTTTIQINHSTLAPNGVFEYQHATGDTIAKSISKGFKLWAETDFITMLDALLLKPQSCTLWEIKFPARNGKPQRLRRAVLGPIMHFIENADTESKEVCEAHPFCPCCFLTNSYNAFSEYLEREGTFFIRFFAMREKGGQSAADCRINGQDYELGAQALRDYVRQWPGDSVEFRRQYVVLQDNDEKEPTAGV